LDIDIRRYFGKGEDDYDYFLMDIHDKEWSEGSYTHNTFRKDGKAFFYWQVLIMLHRDYPMIFL
jgi:hypothetical protein